MTSVNIPYIEIPRDFTDTATLFYRLLHEITLRTISCMRIQDSSCPPLSTEIPVVQR